jgi:hypothetical protein
MTTNVTRDQYKVTIERITTTEYPSQADILVEERHYTDEEVEKSYTRISSDDRIHYTKKVYGKKDIIASKEETKKVYEQIVDAEGFMIKTVIGAINNGMPR